MLIAVLNGPNLNLLGTREPELYGRGTLGEIEAAVRAEGTRLGVDIEWMQTNDEGTLVEAVQALAGRADAAIVNAAALTHTSLAVRDAFLAVRVPFAEVHLSNIFAREEARRRSLLADIAVGIIAGFGPLGYVLALHAIVERLGDR